MNNDQYTINFIRRVILNICLLLNGTLIFGNQQHIDNQIEGLIQLSVDYRQVNSDSSLYFAKQAVDLAIPYKQPLLIADSYNNLGTTYYLQGDYDKSLENFRLALNLYKKTKSNQEIANTKNKIGAVYLNIGNLSEALNYFTVAQDLFITLKNNQAIAFTRNNIGLIYLQQGLYDKSIHFLIQTLQLQPDDALTKQIWSNIGTCYYYKHRYDSALYYYNQCKRYEIQNNDYSGLALSYSNIGLLHLMEGDYNNALESFTSSKIMAEKSNDIQAIINSMNNIGALYLLENKYNLAYEMIDSSIKIAIKHNLFHTIAGAYQKLAILFENNEMYGYALQSFKIYSTIAEQIASEQKKSIHVAAQLDDYKNQAQLHQQKLWILGLFALFVILLTVIIFTIIYLKQKQKILIKQTIATEQRIRFHSVIEAQEQERKRIATDLHDSIGHMLSTAKINMSGLEDVMQNIDPDDKIMLSNAMRLIDDACDEVRTISHNLMPGTLIRLGLATALRDLISKTNAGNGLKISFECNQMNHRLPENIEINLYRIIQELIQNIIRHAHASKASITIHNEAQAIAITVKDNGIGFDTQQIKSSAGIGWSNIYTRIDYIKASITVYSQHNSGTEIKIAICENNTI